MRTRWRITGRFTTTAPLHVGSGAVTTHGAILDKDDVKCDVQAVVKDHAGKPCIPGTAIKGVLRSWGEHFFKGEKEALDRVFGLREADADNAQSGWAEFCTAFVKTPTDSKQLKDFADHVPYWREDRLTGVMSHVSIDRATGAADDGKLFYEEFVPEGVAFHVEITATRLSSEEVALLLAILEHGAGHDTHPFQLGASGADGWGRMEWRLEQVAKYEAQQPRLDAAKVGFGCCVVAQPPATNAAPATSANSLSLDLTLKFQGPFLVNDQSREKKNESETDKTNFTPLRRADGTVWLPASSFRGALRQRAEFLQASLDPKGTVDRVFGHTGQASILVVGEFTQQGDCKAPRQDFVALDRFTGGAADGAKFDAQYADRPVLATRLTLDLAGLQPGDLAIFAAALRDVCEGRVTFGFGGSKGYGEARGELDKKGQEWLDKHAAPTPASAVASDTAASVSSLVQDVLQFVIEKKATRIYLKSRRQDATAAPVKWDALSKDIQDYKNRGKLDDLPVEHELENDEPVRVRQRGLPFESSVSAKKPQAGPGQPSSNGDRFAHPYYFLPLKERGDFKDGPRDANPVSHARYKEGHYSGTIRVKLTTATPLLLCDDQTRRETQVAGHHEYDTRVDADGRPLLASSSVRGMLRAAYEAVTNSRFGVFPINEGKGHTNRLGLRPPANSGLSLVPVRIESHEGQLRARLLNGTTPIGANGSPKQGSPVYAALIAKYARDWNLPRADKLKHGAAAWAYVRPWKHDRFSFWNVEAVEFSDKCPTTTPINGLRPARRSASPAAWDEPRWVRGWVCVTERNIDGKHDERFFFGTGEGAHAELAPGIASQWSQLIQNYQEAHEEELKRGVTRPPALRDFCRFSRHISHDLKTITVAERELSDGTLCFAQVRAAGKGFVVEALYPVMISRKLYALSPHQLVPASLLPATALKDLSPADRVFGWVSQGATGKNEAAHRAQLRVGPVVCVTDDAIENFKPPKILTILGQPKPQQGRFYLGKSDGAAQPNGGSKEERGYQKGNRVRGPKVYPHHRVFSEGDATSNEPSNQNRSVTGWVKEGVSFELTLHVVNLSRFELGALLWLLSRPVGQHLRLGLGKPLGFGSVRAEIVPADTVLADGAAWTACIAKGGQPKPEEFAEMVKEFEDAMNGANPTLLASFKKASEGFAGVPIHYPRTQGQSAGSGEHYEWFTRNEGKGGRQLALPDLLAADPTLPRDPAS